MPEGQQIVKSSTTIVFGLEILRLWQSDVLRYGLKGTNGTNGAYGDQILLRLAALDILVMKFTSKISQAIQNDL